MTSRSKYGKLLYRIRGEHGTVFLYENDDGGFTVRYPGEPVINVNSLQGAQQIAREIAGLPPLSSLL